ncbi:PA2169 family four-helix-bundle protein [Hyunsoonleella rubra]|uniref:PA2169 family four-helix-bundle protein n=1 Tax=Hyunsoonleella rubra TaxID=1737062 RepID=A0ABW5T8F8_9FLAO
MRHLEKNMAHLNSLLHLNYEVEEIYHEVLEHVQGESLKTFFRNAGFVRNEFNRVLRGEIENFGFEPVEYNGVGRMYKRILMKIKSMIGKEEDIELLQQVSNIEQLTIGAYNVVLQERHLPLSVCKVLIEQRDKMQKTINTIEVKEALVA